MACCAISNVVKTSLGPVGLDKMMVDDIGVSNQSIIIYTISPDLFFKFKVKLVAKQITGRNCYQ